MTRRRTSAPVLAITACLTLFATAISFAADQPGSAPCDAGGHSCPAVFAVNRYGAGPVHTGIHSHRRRWKIPEIELRIGNEVITAYFDTGNQGALELTETMAKSLAKRGYLSLGHSEYSYGMIEPHTRARVKGLRHGRQVLHDASHLLFKTGSRNRLGLGFNFNFMKNCITVRDYKRQTLTQLRP